MLPIIKPTLCDFRTIGPAVGEIFASGVVTNAKYVRRFEEACAAYIGVKNVIAVSSATSGLMLAAKGLALRGEVIVPSFTFSATVHALIWNNIKPVFVDCEEGTYNIDVAKIEEKITPRTCAIMPVYIFGNPPRIRELVALAARHKLKLFFDSAQAFGAQYQGEKAGRFGDAEVFSLSPTKVLTALEGGLIATGSDALAAFLRKARDYGKSDDGFDMDHIGLSARMSELHALIGLRNLENFENCLDRRHRLIELYKKSLSSVKGLRFQTVPEGSRSSGNYMVVFVDSREFGMNRDQLHEALKTDGIQTKKYFYPAVHLQKTYAVFAGHYRGNLPVTEKAAQEGLALPLYGHMDEASVELVCRAVRHHARHE